MIVAMSSGRIPTRVPDFRLEELDSEVLLYHPRQTKAVHLNETAALIWQLCDGQRTADDITTLLCQAYPEDAPSVTTDVAATLERLVREGAVTFA